MLQGQSGQRFDLVVIEAADEDGVKFQVVKAGFFRGPDAVQGVLQRAGAGHGGKPIGTQGVQADVQPVHACLPQRRCQLGQESAVGGQAQLLQTGDRAQGAAQLHNTPPHQRLSAC